MIKLKFVNHSRYYGIAVSDPIEPNSLLFFYDDTWNDRGYKFSFDVSYCDDGQNLQDIGRYRIFHSEDTIQEDWNNLKLRLGNLSEDIFSTERLNFGNYFSLALSQSFYTNLYRLLPNADEYKNVLERLCDLTLRNEDDIKRILNAKSKDVRGVDVFEEVIFRDFRGKPKPILNLTMPLKQVDDTLTVGNYLKWENFQKILDRNDSEIFKQIITCFDNETVHDELQKIIEKFINISDSYSHSKAKFILSLVDLGGFDQLATKLKSSINEDLEKIRGSVEEIKKILLYKDTESFDFVHYTTLSTLDILIKKAVKQDEYPVLRLSNARQMNDPKEGMTLLELIGIKASQINNDDYSPSPFFISSMAKVEGDEDDIEDSLPMWKQYGGDTAGISLTYTKECIDALRAKDEIEIYKVCYYDTDDTEYKTSIKPHLKLIKDTIKNQKLDIETVLSFIEPIRYLFKEKSYKYEHEYRIIVNLEGKSERIETVKYGDWKVPRLFTYVKDIPLSYQKVTLGPKADDIDYVAPYIKHVDSNIQVTKSKIPYR